MERTPQRQTSAGRLGINSPSCSTMSLSPSFHDESKRTMQTTVAIVEDDPHRFKICPLRHIPVEQRPSASPSLTFDRPFVGTRLGLPSMYQLASSRSASTYSFNSLLSEGGASQGAPLESPSPMRESASGYSMREPSHAYSTNVYGSETGLGLSLAGSTRSVASLGSPLDLPTRKSNKDLSAAYIDLSQEHSWLSPSPSSGPDLTFAASDVSSERSNVRTPAVPSASGVSPSPSSESFRKAKSMYILKSLSSQHDFSEPVPDPELPASGSSSSSLRRLKSKTLSLNPGSKGQVHRRKRHAIYGDHGMQLSFSTTSNDDPYAGVRFSPELENESSFAPSEPSPSTAAVDRKNAVSHSSAKKPLPSTRRPLELLNPNTPSTSFLSVPVDCKSTFVSCPPVPRSVMPLNISLKRKKQASVPSISNTNMKTSVPHYHPIVRELLQDIDLAIAEWRALSYL